MIWLLLTLGVAAQDQARLLGEIEAFDTQITSLSTEIDSMNERAVTAERQGAEDEAAVKQAEVELGARRDQTARLVAATYRLARHGTLRLLFGAESPWELRRRSYYLSTVLARNEARRQAFAAASEERCTRMQRAEANREALGGLKAELETRRAALEAQRNERMALLKRIRGTPQLAARAIAETETARSEVSMSMAQREGSVPESITTTDTAGFRQLRGSLSRPVSGGIARPFGPYVDSATGQRLNNLGVDFNAALGTPFRAVAAGTVTRAQYVQGYGMLVVLQHGAYTTLYAHANGLRVAQNQVVAKGDVLGLVGNTGLADDPAPRLHFEIRYNNTPQDPTEWLAR